VAFNLLGALLILALSTGLNLLLRPRIKRPKGPTIEFPQADEGVPIPIGYGTFAVAPNIVYWKAGSQVSFTNGTTGYTANMVGTLCLGPMDEIVDIIVGGKSVSFEPVTANQGGDLGAAQVITPSLPYIRTGDADTPTTFIIHARHMFGGNTQEGGIQGEMRFYWGGLEQASDQVTTEYMQEAGLSSGTGRPGVCYVVFGPSDNGDAFYWGTNPTPKDVTFILRHNIQPLEVGYEARDANAAEIIYDLLHSNLRGLGLATSLTDTASFEDVAQTLTDEGCGISPCFSQQDEVEDMIEDVLKHVMGVLRVDPVTGQYNLKLARHDYTPSQLTRVTTSLRGAVYANARNLKLSRPNYRETSNDITLTYRRFETGVVGGVTGQVLTSNLTYNSLGYRNLATGAKNITQVTLYDDGVVVAGGPGSGWNFDPATGVIVIGSANSGVAAGSTITVDYTSGPVFSGYKESTSRWQDLASIQQSGELRSVTLDYPFFTSDLVAAIHAAKLGQQLSRSLWNAQWEMDRHGYDLAPGDVVRLNHEPLDEDGNRVALVDDLEFRITEIDYGLLEDGAITVSAIEDVFAQDALPVMPAPPGTGGSGVTLTAPAVALSYSATSAIRVCLYASDQNFNIRLWRAASDLGLGVTTGATVVATIPGTSTHYDDTQPMAARSDSGTVSQALQVEGWGASQSYGGGQYRSSWADPESGTASRVIMPAGDTVTAGTVYWYAAQLVPTGAQIGYGDGDLTPWQEMTAAAGTPGACTCTIPTVGVASSDVADVGTVTLTVTDPQNRVTLVEFQTQAGTGPPSEWTTDTSPYAATVSTIGAAQSLISYRITYQDCAGASVTNLTGTVLFP
jgi:hypothetical protein